jgi:adenosylmethionine---8-amino-7-oxononanoate aminotransferase
MEPADLDRRYVWHPFTQMREWAAHDPVVIVEAEGALLRDSEGRVYIDGNSSIWTNLHGHRRPELDAAIAEQLRRVAHTSFLGQTNDVAPVYARELVEAFTGETDGKGWRVFFSDDGSTAMEAGLKVMHQARQQRGERGRTAFVSLASGYHGDTVGAMSVGHSGVFHATYRGLMFSAHEVVQPACYRCPYNRATPERGCDARCARKCNWECVGEVEAKLEELGTSANAFVAEPRVQGAGSMAMQPEGYVAKLAEICRGHGVWLMLDEVLTGFGRTGPMFVGQSKKVDVVALGKGITGGYLPFAATIVSEEIYSAFLGEFDEFKTFFHGHSYSGNQLGAAVARASLRLLQTVHTEVHRLDLGKGLRELVQRFWQHPNVGDVRCEGSICAIELVQDFETRGRFPVGERVGYRVCQAARRHGLLTRNIGDVLVLMPPYCISAAELQRAVEALWNALGEVIPMSKGE